MFENALAYLGLQFAKFQFRNDFDTVQPLTQFFRGAESVIITLPVGYDQAIIASNALRSFREKMQDIHITVVHSSTRETALASFPRCEVVRLDPTDINRLSLPTKSMLQRIITHEFDVAVDLNLDFVLHTAYICKASRAKARVGFASPVADMFFNIVLNFNKQRTPQALYESFADCLAMF
jgi:ADP-heptose:LPS heptosyltransferase